MSAATWHGTETLPRQLTGIRSPIVWGIGLLVAIEATVIALFITSYFYLRLGADAWPPVGVSPPDLLRPGVATGLLVASVIPAWLGLRAVRAGKGGLPALALAAGLALAAAYLGLNAWEYWEKDYLWTAHAYGSLDWSMTAYASLHVLSVLGIGGVMWLLTLRGHFGPHRFTGLQALVIYWVFVAVGSLLFFATQYLTPHLAPLGGGG